MLYLWSFRSCQLVLVGLRSFRSCQLVLVGEVMSEGRPLLTSEAPEARNVESNGSGEVKSPLLQEPGQSVRVLYSNVRGLRQAAGELRSLAQEEKPEIFVLTETHLKDDSVEAEMFPVGYKVVARFDRTKHGGGS